MSGPVVWRYKRLIRCAEKALWCVSTVAIERSNRDVVSRATAFMMLGAMQRQLYTQLKKEYGRFPKHDVRIVIGDVNLYDKLSDLRRSTQIA